MRLTKEVKDYARQQFHRRRDNAITAKYERREPIRKAAEDAANEILRDANEKLQEFAKTFRSTNPILEGATFSIGVNYNRKDDNDIGINVIVNLKNDTIPNRYYGQPDEDELRFMAELSATESLDAIETLLDKYFQN